MSIIDHTPFWGGWSIYNVSNVLTNDPCSALGTYYVTIDFELNAYIVFDLGSVSEVMAI